MVEGRVYRVVLSLTVDVRDNIRGVEREHVIEQARQILGRRPDVAAAYLFGSVARGQARRGSDVDVAVLYRREPPQTLDGLGLDLGFDLEEAIGRPCR